MAIVVTHAFVSGFADDPKQAAAGEVLPSHWNANHVVSGGGLPNFSTTTWYVSTTGSDSNDGLTTGTAFATISHAASVAAGFDWMGTSGPTIQVEDGTYTLVADIVLPPLVNLNVNVGAQVLGNITTPSNVILQSRGFKLPNSQWNIGGFQIDTPGVAIALNDISVFSCVGPMIFDDHTNGGTMHPYTGINYCQLGAGGFNQTILPSRAVYFMQLTNYCTGSFAGFGDVITFPVGGCTIAMFSAITNCTMGIGGPSTATYVNSGGVTGAPAMSRESSFSNGSGLLSDLINGSAIIVDATSAIINNSNFNSNWFFQSVSGIPTSSNVNPGGWGVYKDTSGGGLYVVANDGGTIKKVALT